METEHYFEAVKSILTNFPSSAGKDALFENVTKFHQDNKTLAIEKYVADFETQFRFLIDLAIEKQNTVMREDIRSARRSIRTIENIIIGVIVIQVIAALLYVAIVYGTVK